MLKKKVLSSMAVLGLITTSVVPLVIHAEEVLKNEVAQVNATEDTESVEANKESESTPAPESESVVAPGTSQPTGGSNEQESQSEEESEPKVESSEQEASSEEESGVSSQSEEEETLGDETGSFEVVNEEDIEWIDYEIITKIDPQTDEVLEKETHRIPNLNKYFAISKGKRMPVELTDGQHIAILMYVSDKGDGGTDFYEKNSFGTLKIKQEYYHTLYGLQGWENYVKTMGSGYRYIPETDTFEWIEVEDKEHEMQDEVSETYYQTKYPINTHGYYSETSVKNATDEELGAILGYRKLIRVDLSKELNTSGKLLNGNTYEVWRSGDDVVLAIDGGEYLITLDEKGRGTMEIDDSTTEQLSQTLFIITGDEGYENSELPFGSLYIITHRLQGQEDDYKTLADVMLSDEDYEIIPEEERPTTPKPGEETPTTPGEETPTTPGEGEPGQSIVVKTETVKEPIKFDTVTLRDDTLAEGETKVSVEGVDGELTITYEVYYQDGKEVERIRLKEDITTPHVSKVVLVGREGSTGTQEPANDPTGNTGSPLPSESTGNTSNTDNTSNTGNTSNTDNTSNTGNTSNTSNTGVGEEKGANDVELENTGITNPIMGIIAVIAGLGLGGFFLFKGKKGAKEGGNVGE